MVTTYQSDLENSAVVNGPNADASTPDGEALLWWRDRVAKHTYSGASSELPSLQATKVLRRRELIAETPGGWGFVVRLPETPSEYALQRNVWGLVGAVLQTYKPATVDRISAVRLAVGDESIPPEIYVRHGANQSNRQLQITNGHEITLRADPHTTEYEIQSLTLGANPPVSLSVLAPAVLLTALTLGDIRDHLDLIATWLRTLVVSRAALERDFLRDPHPLLMKRMGLLAKDAGNERLADTIQDVVTTHSRSETSRTLTGVGHSLVIPHYVIGAPPASAPWIERLRIRMDRAFEEVELAVRDRDQDIPREQKEAVLSFARAAKADDTYHSTTIEGYRITREEVRAVLEGRPYQGRTPEEIERLMALKGYSRAFDWTLARIAESDPPVSRPVITEHMILDVFLELWGPSIDAEIVDAPTLRAWRNHPVQINGASHVPSAPEKVPGLMTQYVTQLNAANVTPLTRAIVGHWGFVHIHPFRDGNGRIGRLLMNFLLCAAGLPWTTIRAEERPQYFSALERAHTHDDFTTFSNFIAAAVERANGARKT